MSRRYHRLFRERSFIKNYNTHHNKLHDDLNRDKAHIIINHVLPNGQIMSRSLTQWLRIMRLKEKAITKDNVAQVLKNLIVQDGAFVDFAKKYLHQGGIPWSLRAALQERLTKKATSEGFAYGMRPETDYQSKQVWTIYPNNTILIDEIITVKNIIKTGMSWGDELGEPAIEIGQGQTPLIAKARHCIKKEKGRWGFAKTDTTFEYHNKELKEFLDIRTTTSKAKDFFKEFLGKNKFLTEEQSIKKAAGIKKIM